MKSLPCYFKSLAIVIVACAGANADTLVPAGTIINCTISEPNFSSKTAEKGDPILCYASQTDHFSSRTVLPYGTYLSGHFEDYRDPGHFVGKGWMQLTFDRAVMGAGRVVPISAKIVKAPGLKVNKNGRIDGKGHATRDAVEWMIPVMWPEKVITLPMRGPRPALKQETRLELKIMDDLLIPDDIPGRATGPNSGFGLRSALPADNALPQATNAVHLVAAQTAAPAPSPSLPLTLLVMKDGRGLVVSQYWLEGSVRVRYVGADGTSGAIPIEGLDLQMTVAANQRTGTPFRLRPMEAVHGW